MANCSCRGGVVHYGYVVKRQNPCYPPEGDEDKLHFQEES
jgi:hypothetical protein